MLTNYDIFGNPVSYIDKKIVAENYPNILIDQLIKKGLVRTLKGEKTTLVFVEDVNRYVLPDKKRGFYVLNSDKTDYKTIELFAGAGGMALGFENAGFTTTLLNEYDKDASKTLLENRPYWDVNNSDIHNLDLREYYGQIDVVSGGFPCQPFSYTGKGLGLDDTRGTLFYEFARCIKEVCPKVIVAENVRGLTTHDKGKTFQTVLQVIRDCGYTVYHNVLKAQFYDVAQKRERLFIVGVRSDLSVTYEFPQANTYILNLRDALDNVPLSDGLQYPQKKREVFELVPQGGNWRDLPDDVQRSYMGGSYSLAGGKTSIAKRLTWDEPSLTLTTHPAQKQTDRCHPEETRPLTVREYARIQTFPDEWRFSGSVLSQYKQIGNAVPVNLAYHVGKSVKELLDKS